MHPMCMIQHLLISIKRLPVDGTDNRPIASMAVDMIAVKMFLQVSTAVKFPLAFVERRLLVA